jgi:hypothetical protein
MSVHCKKYLLLLPWFSAVSKKKQNVSITNASDLELLEVKKPIFSMLG